MFETNCPTCGRSTSATSLFCGHCGSNLSAPPTPKSRDVSSISPKIPDTAPVSVPIATVRQKAEFGRLDRVLFVGFTVGKVLSVIMTLAFFVVFLVTGIMLFRTTSREFKTPTYAGMHPTENGAIEVSNIDTTTFSHRRNVSSKYGDRFKVLIESYTLDARASDILLGWATKVPTEHQDEFVDGMERFLADGIAFAKRMGKQPDAAEMLNEYHREFQSSLASEEMKKTGVERDRLMLIGALGSSAFLFFLFLVIPALLQIEKNTRAAVPST